VVFEILAAVALLVAVFALVLARRARRKLDSLTQSYWELRYDFTRLRSQVARLEPGEPDETPAPPPPPQGVTFVPLSSMKKKNG
jgi:hypothetical protein